LQDDRVAGPKRGADLPDRHHQRVIPRGDLTDDANRLATDDRRVAAHVLARGPTLEVARGAREEAQVVDHEWNLVLAERVDWLARVVGLELRELLGVLLDCVGQLQQRKRPLAGGGRRPAWERTAGRLH